MIMGMVFGILGGLGLFIFGIKVMSDTLQRVAGSGMRKVPVLEEKVNRLTAEYRHNHIERLNKGGCNFNAGLIFVDIVMSIERIGDHLNNIAQGILHVGKR